jgi:D-alanyl-lipoteichoic acid acyltransferase DltB (MBOAT superfamily)
VLFNSVEFLLFLLPVLATYYLLPHRAQNAFLVLASCFFYASWDWRFLFPLLFSTTIDYYCARQMENSLARSESQSNRRFYLRVSLVTNLGLLGFFKYYNFFAESLKVLLLGVGIDVPVRTLEIILPIGISFYTFQALSYTIDVYRGQIHATKSFWDFFLAVLFFPHLVAGPIQRASNLIAQVVNPRKITAPQVIDGLHLIIWGYFKKVFIADRLAPIVDGYFHASSLSGGEVSIAVIAFAFQIYCDFSGYTDIARGVAKLMGFEFVLNFNLPYFATNPSDFWQRWHISLSTWLRDYLYISLGGNRNGELKTYRNLMLTMLLGGLWHGAAWNFVLWGFYHGALLVIHRLLSPALSRFEAHLPGSARLPWLACRILGMFLLTCYGWLLFRASSLAQVLDMTAKLLHPLQALPTSTVTTVLGVIAPLLVVQVLQYSSGRLDFYRLSWLPRPLVAVTYGGLLYGVLFLGALPQSFVYFQF